MKAKIIIIITLFVCFACNTSTISRFKFVDYSFDNGWNNRFSVFIDSFGTYKLRVNDKCYTGRLSKAEINNIGDKLKEVSVLKQCEFISNKSDQETHKLIFNSENKEYQFLIYGAEYPKTLKEAVDLLQRYNTQKQLSETANCDFPCQSCSIFMIDSFTRNMRAEPPN